MIAICVKHSHMGCDTLVGQSGGWITNNANDNHKRRVLRTHFHLGSPKSSLLASTLV